MTTTSPSPNVEIATPEASGMATVQELWRLADLLAVPPCAVYRATQQFVRLDAQHVGNEYETVHGEVRLTV